MKNGKIKLIVCCYCEKECCVVALIALLPLPVRLSVRVRPTGVQTTHASKACSGTSDRQNIPKLLIPA